MFVTLSSSSKPGTQNTLEIQIQIQIQIEMRMPSDKERQRRSQSRSDHGSLKRVVIYEVSTSGSPTSIEIKAENSVRGRAVYAFLVFFNFVEYLHIHIYAVRIWGTFEMNVQNEWQRGWRLRTRRQPHLETDNANQIVKVLKADTFKCLTRPHKKVSWYAFVSVCTCRCVCGITFKERLPVKGQKKIKKERKAEKNIRRQLHESFFKIFTHSQFKDNQHVKNPKSYEIISRELHVSEL